MAARCRGSAGRAGASPCAATAPRFRRPTVANLRLFDGAASVRDGLARLAGRQIPTIRPRVITDPDGKQRALLPGDSGWY